MSIVLGEFMNYNFKLGVIGAGNMAKAIVSGIVEGGILSSSEIITSARTSNIDVSGVETVRDNSIVLSNSEYLVLAVKPQVYKEIAKFLASTCNAKHIISIMAGVTREMIASDFGDDVSISRVMPNTPCKHKLGMTAIMINNDLPGSERLFVESIFNAIGDTCYIEEDMFHTAICVSGSGTAYVYMFIEGMIKGAMANGYSYDMAKASVLKTFEGAVSMARLEQSSITDLIGAVCSKGGTTIQAVESFKSDNLYGIIDSAMTKCKNRSEELCK